MFFCLFVKKEVISMSRFDGVCACCDQCGGEIYTGEEYYRINGENVCEDCFCDFARTLLRPFLLGGGA